MYTDMETPDPIQRVHLELADVRQKYRLDVEIPTDIFDRSAIQLMVDHLLSSELGELLYGMGLIALHLLESEKQRRYDGVIKIAKLLLEPVRSNPENYSLIATAQVVRTALFWEYMRSGRGNKRLLKTSGRLAAAICNCDEDVMLSLEAALTHGETGNVMAWAS